MQMRRIPAITFVLFAVAGLGFALAAQTAAKAPARKPAAKPEPHLWAPGDMKRVDLTEPKGAQQAVLWGDPTKGAHGVIDKFPAGLELPLHTHTYAHKVVMISGTMTITPDGGSPKELPAGSYLMMPGGVKHSTGCKAGADCVFFSEGSGKFDVKIVPAPKK